MAEFLSQKELIKAIEANLNNLELGTLQLSEIEKHVDLVRELYERTIALRYKAFEHHSSVEISKPKPEEVAPVIEAQEIHKEEVVSKPEVIEEILAEETPEEEQEIEFDFLSSADNITEEEVASASTAVPEQEEIIIEQIQQEDEAQAWGESSAETSEAVSDKTASSGRFTARVFEIEKEIKNQFGFHSLQTLVGSFGLNERLLYINELFDGSSESFSDAVKHLDIRSNLSEAATYIEEIGSKFNWDIESETVEEFIQKLCRRYA